MKCFINVNIQVVIRGVLILGGQNRGEVSLFQEVRIEGLLCTEMSGWNRGVSLYTEVSSFQGVRIEGFHCIQRCPHFRVLE